MHQKTHLSLFQKNYGYLTRVSGLKIAVNMPDPTCLFGTVRTLKFKPTAAVPILISWLCFNLFHSLYTFSNQDYLTNVFFKVFLQLKKSENIFYSFS